MFLFLALFLLTLILQLLVPVWWAFVPLAVVLGAVLGRKPGPAFGQGFAAVALVWLGAALIHWLSAAAPLGSRMASVLPLGGSTLALVLIQGVIGGLLGGFAASAGTAIRRALRPAEA
jgi:hypothetical protein